MTSSTNTPKVPDFEIFHITDIEGKDKGKFHNVGAGFINTNADDGYINFLTVYGKLQVRLVKPKE